MLFISSADRVSGNPVSYYEVKDFAECTNTLVLNELKWRGNFSTRTINNKQQIESRTVWKLCMDDEVGQHPS